LKENKSALKRFCKANASLLASFTASSAHQKPVSVNNTTSSVSPPKEENKKDESKKKRSMPVFLRRPSRNSDINTSDVEEDLTFQNSFNGSLNKIGSDVKDILNLGSSEQHSFTQSPIMPTTLPANKTSAPVIVPPISTKSILFVSKTDEKQKSDVTDEDLSTAWLKLFPDGQVRPTY